jgi:hypothetical protein
VKKRVTAICKTVSNVEVRGRKTGPDRGGGFGGAGYIGCSQCVVSSFGGVLYVYHAIWGSPSVTRKIAPQRANYPRQSGFFDRGPYRGGELVIAPSSPARVERSPFFGTLWPVATMCTRPDHARVGWGGRARSSGSALSRCHRMCCDPRDVAGGGTAGRWRGGARAWWGVANFICKPLGGWVPLIRTPAR